MQRKVISILSCFVFAFSLETQANRLNIMVDERMELLTTIQYLSDYPVLTPANLDYKKDIDNYFKNFKNHPAVLLNKKIYRQFFAFDAPPSYIYYFSFPDFKQVAPFSKEDLEYGFETHSDTLTLLLQEFKDFYEKSQFHKFYTDHKDFYDSLLRPVKELIAATDIINVLETYYGQKNKEYNIVLTPLLNDGGYGPQISMPDGQVLYAIIGPKYSSKNIPEFDLNNLMSEYIIHEFSHSFCNPLIANNMDRLEKDSCLLAPIKESQEEQGYGRWTSCLYEHFVRANEIVLTEKVFGKARSDEAYTDMVGNWQWVYLEGLVPIIRQYEADRRKYKTEDDIMPLVVAYFDEKARECR